MAQVEQRDNKSISVDRGWAWLVAFGMGSWYFAIGGTIKCSGFFFTEFLELFDDSLSLTSLIGASLTFSNLIACPFAGIMRDKSSHTAIRCVLGLVASASSISMFGSVWCGSLYQAIIFFGVVPGLGSAVLDVFILSAVSLYFKKRRFLAHSLATCGGSAGGIIMPFLVSLILREYGIRGAMMFIAGVWLQIVVVAFIIRPLTPRDKEYLAVSEILDIKSTAENQYLVDKHALHQDESCLVCDIDDDLKAFEGNSWNLNNKCKLPRDSSVYPDDECNSIKAKSTHDSSQMGRRESALNTFAWQEEKNVKQKSCFSVIKECLLVLCSPGLPSLSITFLLSSTAYYTHFFLLPPFLKDVGISQSFSTAAISLWCVSELIGRSVVGYISDRYPRRVILLLCMAFIVSAGSGFCVCILRSQWIFLAYAVVLGCIGGAHVPLVVPMLIEKVPPRWAGSAVALYSVVTGIGCTCGPPIVSLLKTCTGTYVSGLLFLSACYTVAFLSLLLSYLPNAIPCGDDKHRTKPSLTE